MYDILKKSIENENIRYNDSELKNVVEYAEGIYGNSKRYKVTLKEHFLNVAIEVSALRLDDISVYAALLAGSIRCNDFNEKELLKKFGSEIVSIVKTVEKVSYLNYKTKEKVDSENIRKMFMAIAKDVRSVIIKLVDRLYNMRNIENVEEEIKHNMAGESLHVYAPIAHRLGMSQIKSELEDISFRVLMKDEYYDIKKQIDEKKTSRQQYIEEKIEEIKEYLKNSNIKADVYGRPKHFYSIYKKIKEKGCRADDLFDLLAIRIVTDSIKDCYTALGICHDLYKPVPGRFKDYIAMPKTNMYQSLHTTVFGKEAKPFEIQIRTWDMHKIADIGVAAHFSYKEKTSKVSDADKKLVWLRQSLEIQKELTDNTQNIDKLKVELFGEEVFVFTPKGDIKSLPKGATGIDFAYMIHQKIAEQMIGVKINSRLVPITTKLENTDIVDIVTSKSSAGPSIDWLKHIKTTSAKNKIMNFLKKKGREENIQRGRDIFDKQIRKSKITKEELLKEENVLFMLKKMNLKTFDECLENIGFGCISALKVVNRLQEHYDSKNENEISKHISSSIKKHKVNQDLVIVDNIKGCLVKFAKCCMPIPGDDIVGYITYSNGVSVHTSDCANLSALDIENRRIKVSWRATVNTEFKAKITVRANSRDNLINDTLKMIKDLKISLAEFTTKDIDTREIQMVITINISDTLQLMKCIKGIKKVDSVFEVKRGR